MVKKNRNPGEDDEEVDLSALDQDFRAAPKASTAIPDGHYPVRIEHVELSTTRSSRRPVLKWTLRPLVPEYRNRLLWKKSVLRSPDGMKWLKHDLSLCGIELDKLSDLPTHLDSLVGIELHVTKRTRGDWENVHFNRRLQPGAAHADDSAF